MEYTSKEILLKNGRTCLLRLAEESEAEMLLEYLQITSAETRNMVREPEEVRTSVEEEAEFIRKNRENPRALHLLAFVGGALAGSCSFGAASERIRMRHRCTVGISLYRNFWGMGIGTALMGEILRCAREAGFEQAELTVVSTNASAIGLYKKLGFETTGTIPRAFKYRDGTYADFLFMVKDLTL
ncbi:MAG: GNAT family N-acetyltransferase [Oscillospiraceae bacterium]|nr:GNAT family N-acetyltransferase [Oscillospiraceae bacterium]